jgi:hypothetical protein
LAPFTVSEEVHFEGEKPSLAGALTFGMGWRLLTAMPASTRAMTHVPGMMAFPRLS